MLHCTLELGHYGSDAERVLIAVGGRHARVSVREQLGKGTMDQMFGRSKNCHKYWILEGSDILRTWSGHKQMSGHCLLRAPRTRREVLVETT